MLSLRVWSSRAWALIRLGRPIFLAGGVAMYLLGAAAALSDGVLLDMRLLVLGQIAVTSTQLMTHYLNDAFDVTADRANLTPTLWSGGSRVLLDGILTPGVSLATAGVLALIALATGLVLSVVHPLALLIIALALVLSAAYSTPPARLHSTGFGELVAAIVVSGLTPLLGFVLQAGKITLLPVLTSASLFPLQLAMLTGVAFPDAVGDALVGKRTLVVRLGDRAGRLYIGLIFANYLLLPVWVWLGLPAWVAGSSALLMPLGLWHAGRVWRGDWRNPARQAVLAFGGIALLIGSALVELLLFCALAGMSPQS